MYTSDGYMGTSTTTGVIVGGVAAITALIGWGLWTGYQNKKSEAEGVASEIEILKAQAGVDEGRRQELIGQAILKEIELGKLQAEVESLRTQIGLKIDNLPNEDYQKLPGEVIEEIKGSKFPWTWVILGGVAIGGVTLWKNKKSLSTWKRKKW